MNLNKIKAITVLMFLVLLSVQLKSQNLPSYLPSNGLIAWYPFNGSTLDESGNANHCTNQFGATLTSDRFNNSNSAYSSDNNAMACPFTVASPINSYTISTWFKVNTILSKGGVIGIRAQTQWSLYGLHASTNGNKVTTEHFDSNFVTFKNLSLNSIFKVNQWQHCVTTYDGLKIRMYVNGVIIDSTSVQHKMPPTLSFISIIGEFRTLLAYPTITESNPFKRLIDDVAIYDRALSNFEVKKLFEADQNNTGFKDLQGNNKIQLYPNPVSNILTLNVENSDLESSFKIFDIVGKEVMSGICLQKTEIDLSNLNKGVYFIKIGDSVPLNHKFTKE